MRKLDFTSVTKYRDVLKNRHVTRNEHVWGTENQTIRRTIKDTYVDNGEIKLHAEFIRRPGRGWVKVNDFTGALQ